MYFEEIFFRSDLFSKWLFFEVTDFIVTHFWSNTFFFEMIDFRHRQIFL